MGKVDIKINGFWLLIIGVFVILPAIKLFTGGEKTDATSSNTRSKVISGKSNVLEVNKDTTAAPINTEVKIPIDKGTVIVKKVSPDKGEPEVIKIKGKYAITSFNKIGSWDINMYDINGLLINWIRVAVY